MNIKDSNDLMRLRYIFITKSGATPRSGIDGYWNGDICWITPEDLGNLNDKVIYDTRRKLSFEGYNSCGPSLAPTRSIVLSKRAPIGQTAILGMEAACKQGCFLLSPRTKIDERFFYYCLIHIRPKLEILGRGSTFMELSADDLRSIKLPNPIFDNQKRIADYLGYEINQIDELMTEKEQMLALLEEKRAALISHAVTHGLNPDVPLKISGIPWIRHIPRNWEVRRSKYLFGQASIPVQEGDEIVTCFRDGQVTLRRNRREDGFTNAVLELGYQGIREGQLVLHSMDAFAGAIGVSDSNGKCSPEYIICEPINSDVISTYYAKLLRVMALRGYILAACPAVRERAPRIRFSHFSGMELPLPPRDEQEQIVAAIAEEREQTAEMEAALNKSIELLKERRSALITAAVTGQLDIKGE